MQTNIKELSKKLQKEIPSHLMLKIQHLHDGNSRPNQRHKSKYITIARLIDRESGETLAKGKARCRVGDVPDKATGRLLATQRALTELVTRPASQTTRLSLRG